MSIHPLRAAAKGATDQLFHKVDGVQVILLRGGVYKQVDAYRKLIDGEHRLFARFGGGFISLGAMNGTSHPGTSWLDIEADDGAVLYKGKLGRPCFDPAA